MAEGRGKIWSDEETRCLLGLWGDQRVLSQLETARNKEAVKKLVDGMRHEGFDRTAQQIRTKMRDLKYRYRKAKKQNERSGSGRITCPYYDELDRLLGGRPATRPHNTVEANFSGSESSEDEDDDDTASTRSITPPPDSSAESTGGDTSVLSIVSSGDGDGDVEDMPTDPKDKDQTGNEAEKGQTGNEAEKGQTGKEPEKGQTGKEPEKGQTGKKTRKPSAEDRKRKGPVFKKVDVNKKKSRVESTMEGLQQSMSKVQEEGLKKQVEINKERDESWREHELRISKLQQEADRDMMSNMMGQFMGMMGQFMTMFGPGGMPQHRPMYQYGAHPNNPPFQNRGPMPNRPPFQDPAVGAGYMQNRPPFQDPAVGAGRMPNRPPFQDPQPSQGNSAADVDTSAAEPTYLNL
ncbi:PREDICTED: trihelix transcription factor GT-3a-like isoform X2 [Branchiostoma belcheri]|uniref:Trihelix transcription factor GT-3a-like isoform X2 n=1 Tax=Branchiostoma belcheri TaxID=7741 RepID=A0A6P4XZA7_BRABE|nr:PREDICTED: trihelix transcription factor GT-3a-like isoform X2 [Branchiostoma belcheri]